MNVPSRWQFSLVDNKDFERRAPWIDLEEVWKSVVGQARRNGSVEQAERLTRFEYIHGRLDRDYAIEGYIHDAVWSQVFEFAETEITEIVEGVIAQIQDATMLSFDDPGDTYSYTIHIDYSDADITF